MQFIILLLFIVKLFLCNNTGQVVESLIIFWFVGFSNYVAYLLLKINLNNKHCTLLRFALAAVSK